MTLRPETTASIPAELSGFVTALKDRYAVERELGRGGMATVYLARDLKHDRLVAVKVLNPELAAVLGAERFLSEIRVTANLQHPNLLPLFDSGEGGGMLFYVMPYVEGESLRARLDRERQLPVDEAVRIALAVGGALDYAHSHGVIHRDLKPENILLQHGQPVVADFGIALAVSNAGGQRVTQTGLSLGTPQYMSPEQATGDRAIDGRSDLYSLGAILYEMLVGDPPHTASTAQAVIAKVLTEPPRDVRASRASVPEHVAATVHAALEKLAADRFATAREFCDALGGRAAARSTTVRQATRRGRLWRVAPWAVAVAASAVAVVATVRRPATLRRPVVLAVVYPDSVAPPRGVGTIALSPDGRTIAFGGAVENGSRYLGLYVRQLDDPATRLIPGTEDARWPAFSADGRAVYFAQNGKLYRTALTGGVPTFEQDSVLFVSVGDRGSLLIDRGGRIARIPSGAREPIAVPIGDAMELTVFASRFPEFLPGERHMLVTGRRIQDGAREIALIDAESGALTWLGIQGTQARYSGTGHLVFVSQEGALMAVPFSLRRRVTTGPAERIATGIALGSNGAGAYALSPEGTLVALHGAPAEMRHLELVDSTGRATRLTTEPRQFGWSVLSPDGRRVAVEVGTTAFGPWDVWVFDLDSRSLSRVTRSGRGIRPGGWDASGDTVIFIQGTGGIGGFLRVVAQASDGSGTARTLMEYDRPIQIVSVGPPGTWIAAAAGRLGAMDIVVAPLDSPRTAREFIATPANEAAPRVSPDGKLLAYTSDESGRYEVYMRPLSGPGARIQVSSNGGSEPVWDRGSTSVFYRDATSIIRAYLDVQPRVRLVRRQRVLSHAGLVGGIIGPAYDVLPGGRQIIAISGVERPLTAMLYLDWSSRLRGENR